MALTANELRIGNMVTHRNFNYDDYFTIRSVSNDKLYPINVTDKIGYAIECTLYDLSNIPLSPEILEKCGFKKHNNYYTKDEFYIFEAFNSGKCFSYSTDQYYVELTSLHQLQNLYYSLTGEELILNPELLNPSTP